MAGIVDTSILKEVFISLTSNLLDFVHVWFEVMLVFFTRHLGTVEILLKIVAGLYSYFVQATRQFNCSCFGEESRSPLRICWFEEEH
jgi:hypothetical protein